MALSSEDIQKIVNRFAAKRKGWEQMTQSTPLNPITKQRAGSQYPEYWSGYNYAAKMYDSILPHSRSDVYPEHLLSVRAPNQTDAQAQYIKANYKATTLSVSAVTSHRRIANGQSHRQGRQAAPELSRP